MSANECITSAKVLWTLSHTKAGMLGGIQLAVLLQIEAREWSLNISKELVNAQSFPLAWFESRKLHKT